MPAHRSYKTVYFESSHEPKNSFVLLIITLYIVLMYLSSNFSLSIKVFLLSLWGVLAHCDGLQHATEAILAMLVIICLGWIIKGKPRLNEH